MSAHRYRLIDTAGSELGFVEDERPEIGEGDPMTMPDGALAVVVEVYDDETGREGGVLATLVVEES